MIRLDHVTLTYPDAGRPVLHGANLSVDEGRLCLVAGRTGSGKTTLLRLLNGLVPHFTGGSLVGRVLVDGRDTRDHAPRELADLVGSVAQDPLHGFVTDTVEEELAYGMEQLGLPPRAMRQRVEETLDLLGIADLRDRPLRDLSGGQQQRVAIGSVLAAGPRILVLDEPTSALDPGAAEEVLAAVLRLVHDVGLTVVVAEHRLERAIGYADHLVLVPGDGSVVDGPPGELTAQLELAPPIVELSRVAGWDPLPMTVRDARPLASPLRLRLAGPPPRDLPAAHSIAMEASGLTVRYGRILAVQNVDLTLHHGEVAVLMGRNGSGKSSLLWALQGSGPRSGGHVRVHGSDPIDLPPAEARRIVGLVPQVPSDLLYLDSVGAECVQSDADANARPGTTRRILERLGQPLPAEAHPRDLSEGQRLALVLAIQLAAAPPVLLLDEPTRGLDYPTKSLLVAVLRDLARNATSVLVSTHDVELAAALAARVIVMATGEIVADGSPRDVLGASPGLAPQVAKILGPEWLTVDQVRAALAAPPAAAAGEVG